MKLTCCSNSFKAPDGGTSDPVPVPYRYSISPAPSGKCNSFRPAELKDSDTVRQTYAS